MTIPLLNKEKKEEEKGCSVANTTCTGLTHLLFWLEIPKLAPIKKEKVHQ